MSGLLEVIALHAADAERAEAGGADRVELCGSLDDGGMSPEPALVEKVRAATSVQLRVMVRLRAGFGTDGGEAVRLKGLIASYADAGADGMVLGFLNGMGEVDPQVVGELTAEGDWPWTFHRAIDSCLYPERGWAMLRRLGRCAGARQGRSLAGRGDHGRRRPAPRSCALAGAGRRPRFSYRRPGSSAWVLQGVRRPGIGRRLASVDRHRDAAFHRWLSPVG